MFYVKNFCLILILLFSSLASSQFVEEGNSSIATSADALYPVTDGNNVTFYRQVEGQREAAFIISASGDNKIDIRGHANVKSLYLNGKSLFDENGAYQGKPFSAKDIKDRSIDSDHLLLRSVKGEHIKLKSIDKSLLKPIEVLNITNSNKVGIVYSYCPFDSVLITGGCEIESGQPIEVSRPVFTKQVSGWKCMAPISTYIRSWATCFKGIPFVKKSLAPL